MDTLKVIGLFLLNAVMLPVAYGLLRLIWAVPHNETAFATVEFMLAVACCGGSTVSLYLFMKETLRWELPVLVMMLGVLACLLTGLYPAFAHDFLQPGAFFAGFAALSAGLMFAFSLAWTVIKLRNPGEPQQEQTTSN